jgi:hypothetical protein
MTASCGACGKALVPGGTFCGGCGAATARLAPAAGATSGGLGVKIALAVIVAGGAVAGMAAGGAYYLGKQKSTESRKESGMATRRPDSAAAVAFAHQSSGSPDVGSALLSKEEVGAIIGVPVTSIEMSGESDATYKTAAMGLEASIEVERKNDEADAIRALAGARQVTKGLFGGKAEAITGLGDDALYGAFNVLYVRKRDVVLTIMPPNLQQAAQLEAYTNMTSQPLGSDGQQKALENLQQTMKGDPGFASLAQPDAVSGAGDLVRHAASEQGTEYETKARAMARQMAEQVLTKIGR